MKDLYSLNAVLEEKDDKISELENKIVSLNRKLDTDLIYWRETRDIPVDDFRKDLPVPRLEMIHERIEGYGSQWTYGIVRNAHQGMRSEWDKKCYNFTPLSNTTTSSNSLTTLGEINYPFRDSAHIEYDMISLGFKGFLTCPELGLIKPIIIRDNIELQGLDE